MWIYEHSFHLWDNGGLETLVVHARPGVTEIRASFTVTHLTVCKLWTPQAQGSQRWMCKFWESSEYLKQMKSLCNTNVGTLECRSLYSCGQQNL